MKSNVLAIVFILCGLHFFTDVQASPEQTVESQILEKGGAGDPGGGGVLKYGSAYRTLSESGFFDRSKDLFESTEVLPYFLISVSLKNKVEEIINSTGLPEKNVKNLVKKIIGNRNTFYKLDQSTEENFNKMKQDYESVLKKFKTETVLNNFLLAAYSLNSKTYILSTFEKLKIDQQAFILIHEYFIREKEKVFQDMKDRLFYVLNMDSVLHKAYNGKNKSEVLVKTVYLLQIFKEVHSKYLAFNVAKTVFQNEFKRPLLYSDLFIRETDLTVSLNLIKNYDQKIPGFSAMLEGSRIAYFSSQPVSLVADQRAEMRADCEKNKNLSESQELVYNPLIGVDEKNEKIILYQCHQQRDNIDRGFKSLRSISVY